MGRNLAPLVLDNATDEILVRSANGDENYASKAQIIADAKTAVGSDLPEDFIVSCVNNATGTPFTGSKIMYITDQERYLEIEPAYVPVMSSNAQAVEVIGNDIYVGYRISYSEGYREYGVVRLNCRIVDNILVVNNSQQVNFGIQFPSSTAMHCEGYADGYLYYATRVTSGDCHLIKVNANNVEDFKVTIPFQGGYITNIEVIENYVYFLYVPVGTISTDANPAKVLRIDTSFAYPVEEVFELGLTDAARVRYSMPFVIYEGEIYVITHSIGNGAPEYNNIGIQVYDMNGKLKRENLSITLGSGAVTGKIFPHWLVARNGILVGHCAVSASSYKAVFSIDCYTLTLIDNVPLPDDVLTDDNTLTLSGEVYLNSEKSDNTGNMYYIEDYRDLTTISVLVPNYFSGGTPSTKYKKTGLQTAPTLQSVTDNGNNTTNNINFNDGNLDTVSISGGDGDEQGSVTFVDNDGFGNLTRIAHEDFYRLIDGVSYNYDFPNANGIFALSASVNGGTPVQADANGNIDLTVSGGGATPNLKQVIEVDGVATALTVPVSVETSDTLTLYGANGVNIGDGGTTAYGTVLTTGSAPASYQNDVTAAINSDNDVPNKKYVDTFRRVIYNSSTEISLTGSTAETALTHITIPANTLSNGALNLRLTLAKTGTAGTTAIKIYKSTTPDLTGTLTQLGTVSNGATSLYMPMERNFNIKGGNILYGYPFNVGAVTDSAATTVARASTAFDVTVQQYIVIAVTLSSLTDTIILDNLGLMFSKNS